MSKDALRATEWPDVATPGRNERLAAAAQRARAEADARRAARERDARLLPPELQGRGGPDPVRYGDWEVNCIAVDF